MIYLALIAALAIGALIYEKRQNSTREREWALERGALLQRIQAPEAAVIEYAREDRTPPPKVGFDNDEEFIAAKKAMNGNG